MAVGRLAVALGRGAVRRAGLSPSFVHRRASPLTSFGEVVPPVPRMGRSALPGEARAAVVQPVVPPGATGLPVHTHSGVSTDISSGLFGSGARQSRGVYRTPEELAAARSAAGPQSQPSLGSQPTPLEAQIIKEQASAAGILKPPTRRDISDIISDPRKGALSSYELGIIAPLNASNGAEFAQAIRVVRLLRNDPKLTAVQRQHIDDTVVDVARNRFGFDAETISSLMAGAGEKVVTGKAFTVASNTANGWLRNATTPEDMTQIYNFVLSQNMLNNPTFRNKFLMDFQRQMDRIGRGEVRRIIGDGSQVNDDVAAAVWANISSNNLRGSELLLSVKNPKVNDYANALRTSYTKRELDEVGAMVREAAPSLKQADSEMLFGLYSKQQELVFANAFNRIQNWLKQEQGQQMKVMSSEVIRLRSLPAGPKIEFPQPLRSKAKGVRKATDPSSSPIEGGSTGSWSWRSGEGEMGISQMRTQALNTADLHQSYVTRAALRQKATESSSVFTRTVKRGDDRIGQRIENVTFADAGLRQPYVVGKAHDNVTVRMSSARPVQGAAPRKGESAEDFARRVGDQKLAPREAKANVGRVAADRNVDRVFQQNLMDDLTLMTRPDSDFVLRHTTGQLEGQVYRELTRAPMTRVSEGLPNNLTPQQAREFMKTLDLRELQRQEMQSWVDRYGYRMIYDIRYARTVNELDEIAQRAAAAYVSGMSPKGFHEIIKQTLSQRAAMLPQTRFTSPGRKGGKKYRPPEFRFKGATSFEDFMNYLASNVPSGGAARSQGVRGIQFPQ